MVYRISYDQVSVIKARHYESSMRTEYFPTERSCSGQITRSASQHGASLTLWIAFSDSAKLRDRLSWLRDFWSTMPCNGRKAPKNEPAFYRTTWRLGSPQALSTTARAASRSRAASASEVSRGAMASPIVTLIRPCRGNH
jgi:hypothetical protein